MTRRARLAALIVILAAPGLASAEVVRLDIQRRSQVIGGAVSYELLTGTARFVIDPRNPRDTIIADADKAPRNRDSRVEFTADICILRPADPASGNGALLVDVLNRGNKTVMRLINRASATAPAGGNALSTAAEFGDRFLLLQGFTIVWVGWQGDLTAGNGVMRLSAPIATDNSAPITGWVRVEHTPSAASATLSLAATGHRPYGVVDPGSTQHVLTVREASGPRQVIPRGTWRFVSAEAGPAASAAPSSDAASAPKAASERIALNGGFQPGRTYELVYRATDPFVAGLGLAAIRDVASFFKYDRRAPFRAARALAFGASQSGRLLRTFLYDGFNVDESGRQVFDGFFIHAAGASRGSFNQRFAQPSFSGPAATLFPFADMPQTDPETKTGDALLARLGAQRPKIVYTNSSAEYWWLRRAALQHTSLDGKTDLALPEHVRAHFFAGTQHTPSVFPPAADSGARAAANPNDHRWALRALLVALDRWVKDGTKPPPSALPSIGEGTLVPFAQVKLPSVPGLDRPSALSERAVRLDYGPRFGRGLADYEPPREGAALPILLPQVDADGNEIGGVRLPDVAVPLATFTGWNLRRPASGGHLLAGPTGSFVPFARTRDDRMRRSDPRRAIQERYGNANVYLAKYREAALALIDKGYLLEDDLMAIMTDAAGRWMHLTKP